MQPEPAAQPPMNLGQLKDLVGDDPEAIRDLLETFVKSGRERVQALRVAVEANNAPQIRHEAHSIKGASGNYGAMRLYELAAQMEKEAAKGTTAGAAAQMEQLNAEYSAVERYIEGLLAHN